MTKDIMMLEAEIAEQQRRLGEMRRQEAERLTAERAARKKELLCLLSDGEIEDLYEDDFSGGEQDARDHARNKG